MSIPVFANKIKGFVLEHRQMLIFIGILIGTAIVAFYLGYVAREEIYPAPPVIIQCPANAYMDSAVLGTVASAAASAQSNEKSDMSTVGSGSGAFVASKTGKKYYPLACSGAKRIKDANKIFFQTAAEAQAAGLSLGAGC